MGTGLGTGMGSNWELDAVGANIAGGLSLWGGTPLLKSEDPLHGQILGKSYRFVRQNCIGQALAMVGWLWSDAPQLTSENPMRANSPGSSPVQVRSHLT